MGQHFCQKPGLMYETHPYSRFYIESANSAFLLYRTIDSLKQLDAVKNAVTKITKLPTSSTPVKNPELLLLPMPVDSATGSDTPLKLTKWTVWSEVVQTTCIITSTPRTTGSTYQVTKLLKKTGASFSSTKRSTTKKIIMALNNRIPISYTVPDLRNLLSLLTQHHNR